MAFAFRQSSNQGNASGAGLTVTKPTGTVDGDLIIVVAYLETGTNTWSSVGAGFTRVAQTPEAGTEFTVQMWWKWASGEPASWTWTPTTTPVWRTIVAASYSGGSGSGSAIDVSSSNAGLAQLDTSQTAPSVTTTVANDLLVYGYGNFGGVNPTGMNGAAGTLRVALGGCAIADADIAAAGATGTSNETGAGTQDFAAIHGAFFLSPGGAAGPAAKQRLIEFSSLVRANYW